VTIRPWAEIVVCRRSLESPLLESIAPALDLIRDAVGPYYVYLKFFHLFFVMIWSWSTAVAYLFYVRVAYVK
jgi:hypothetical protein